MNAESTTLLDPVPGESLQSHPVLRTDSDKPKNRRSRNLLFAGTALLVLVYAIPILSFAPGRDQGTYLQIGQSLLEGKHLYSQLWDNKPPGIFLVYALIAKALGRVMWSPALVDFCLLLIISYFLFKFVARYIGPVGAAIAVVIHAAWHSGMRYFWIAQPETLQVLCVLGAYLILASLQHKWRVACFAAGLVCGFGFWLKYNFLVFVPFLLFLPFLNLDSLAFKSPHFSLNLSWQDWLKRVVFVGAGFLLLFALVMAWIIHSGAWAMMRESQFEVLPRYARMGVSEQPHYWLLATVRTYYSLRLATMLATIAVLIIGWRSRDLKRLMPLFLAATVALASTVSQVRFHSYYFQVCYPFLAALWAYLAIRLFEGAKMLSAIFTQQNWRLAMVLTWVLFGNIVFWPIPKHAADLFMNYIQLQQWYENRQSFYANYPDQLSIELLHGQLDTVAYVKQRTKPGDSIYLWGSNSLIYFLSDRQPPTRFVLNLGVIAKWGKDSWKQEIMYGVRESRPRLIIVTKHDALPTITYVDMDSDEYLRNRFPELRDYISANYKRSLELKDFVIYQRD